MTVTGTRWPTEYQGKFDFVVEQHDVLWPMNRAYRRANRRTDLVKNMLERLCIWVHAKFNHMLSIIGAWQDTRQGAVTGETIFTEFIGTLAAFPDAARQSASPCSINARHRIDAVEP